MRYFLLVVLSGFVFLSQAINASTIWFDNSSDAQKSQFVFRALTADKEALKSALDQAPMEFSGHSDTEINLPMPDGSNQRFRIEESPILAPELAAKFPGFKTYRVFGIDDPSASGRIGLIDDEFHGLVDTGNGTIWIDSTTAGNNYRSYYKRDFVTAHRGSEPMFSCGTHYNPANNDSPLSEFRALAKTEGARRNYRLAVATTGEYTAFHGGTVNGGMAAIVTTMNRVNQIYNRDLNVHMTLVANNSQLVYTNSSSDPYNNNSGGAMLSQNQSTIDNVIGSSNYDIGHVFSTGGGGVAGIRAVCSTSRKAMGVTGQRTPRGDPFDIDYVAHEIGHQFGGNHTFNGTAGACSGNRNGSTAYEPGSGTTIMAYAGICGSENTQSNSDATFHAGSIAEMTAFISAGGSCFTTPVASSNVAPTVNAGSDYTIPRSTPFVLTGTASDSGNTKLVYQWDQMDAGASTNSSSHGTDRTTNALMRSFNPTCDASRTFPNMDVLRANSANSHKAETLPTTNRNLNFRFTARDLEGGVNEDDMRITVDAGTGPFAVTSPNTAVLVDTTSPQTVTWNVAGTTAGSVNCATVDISLSLDGGHTFATQLVAATPNDGSESVTYPSTATRNARIKVQCSNNVFFDISNVSFGLTTAANPGPLNSLPDIQPPTTSTCKVVDNSGNNPPIANAGADQTVNTGATVNLNGASSSDPDGDTISYAWAEANATGVSLSNANTATPSFTAPANAASITLRLTVTDSKGASAVDTVTITVSNGTPPANSPPTANAGPDQSVSTGATVNLNGSGSSDPDSDPITYAWTEVTSTGISLTGANTATPSFTAPANATTVTLQLNVTDNKSASGTDTVEITVSNQPTNNPTTPPSSDGGSSAMNPVGLLLIFGLTLLLSGFQRLKRN